MSEVDCRRVGEAIAELGSIPPDTVQAVVEQFCLDMNEEALLPKDGVEYLADVFPDIVGKERATKVLWGIGDLG